METALTRLTTLSSEEKGKKGILYTPGEIYNQVELWSDTFRRFKGRREELADFLTRFKKNSRLSSICTGAGTSEFVGYCIDALMRKKLGVPVNVISTPKIVTTPQDFFIDGYATLLLSFARSGNSPESLGAVKIADMLCKKVYHLVITCNEQGALLREINGRENSAALVLDDKTNDRGLAMTAAFSNMLVAGQMLSYLFSFQEYEAQFDNLLQAGKAMRDKAPAVVPKLWLIRTPWS